MFLTENVPALFKKATLKLVKGDDGGVVRAVEAALVFEPFTPDLAREMGEDIAGHIFGEDDQIRAELSSVDLRPRVGALRITARPHVDLPAIVLEPVGLRSVSAMVREDEKGGTRWVILTVTLVFSLESKVARDFVLDHFGRQLAWTFEPLQRELPDLKVAQAMGRMASTVRDGGITSMTMSCIENGTVTDSVTIDREAAKRIHANVKSMEKAAHA